MAKLSLDDFFKAFEVENKFKPLDGLNLEEITLTYNGEDNREYCNHCKYVAFKSRLGRVMDGRRNLALA